MQQHLARIVGWCLLLVSLAPTDALHYAPEESIPTGPGVVDCWSWDRTNEEVNRNTCAELAESHHKTLDFFFLLNPDLDKDCSDIRPDSEYCVAGSIEKPTTDGKCGFLRGHGFLTCDGGWGDCCSFEGNCGTGRAFCGLVNCLWGECDDEFPDTTSAAPMLATTVWTVGSSNPKSTLPPALPTVSSETSRHSSAAPIGTAAATATPPAEAGSITDVASAAAELGASCFSFGGLAIAAYMVAVLVLVILTAYALNSIYSSQQAFISSIMPPFPSYEELHCLLGELPADYEGDERRDESGLDSDEEDYGELLRCCGEDRPTKKWKLTVTPSSNSAAGGFVTVHDYVSAVHPWLMSLRAEIAKADNVWDGNPPEYYDKIFVEHQVPDCLMTTNEAPYVGVIRAGPPPKPGDGPSYLEQLVAKAETGDLEAAQKAYFQASIQQVPHGLSPETIQALRDRNEQLAAADFERGLRQVFESFKRSTPDRSDAEIEEDMAEVREGMWAGLAETLERMREHLR
ncbi:hypothetical protein PG984_009800 [Apiospora sp. TS-2023a]